MRQILVLVCFLFIVSQGDCLVTYSYTYNNSVNSPIRLPAYPLGYIDGNTSIDFDIRAWNTLVTLSTVTATLVTAGTFVQVGSNIKSCTNSQACHAIFYVDVPGIYYLKLGQTAPSVNYVQPFYLVVTTYPGHTTYVGNPQMKQILRTGDVLREFYIGKAFYIASKSTVTFKLGPFDTDPGAGNPPLAIYPTDPVTFAYSGAPDALVATYVNRMLVGSRLLNPGYYFFVLNNAFTEQSLTVFWQSDSYDCQYDPSYYDIYSLAQGCTHSQAQEGYPCKVFNDVTQRCTECLSNYNLDPISGSCLSNITCPPRQYFHFGVCNAVSDKCLDFDFFTGNCLTCISEDYVLTQGQCLLKTVVCGDRQWKNGLKCINIPDSCATFDPSNGNCLSCRNNTLQLINNTCVTIVVICPSGQYEFNFSCLPIPTECAKFDFINRVCENCIQGYYFQFGQCQRIICPPNQAPSRFGLFCVEVSPLCSTYDPLNGDCLSCKYPNYRVNPNGECVQYVSPLAGCRERQNLGFGECKGSELNCFAYNLVTGDCDKCQEGFSIDFTGVCTKDVECPAGKWSINGECLAYPANCMQVNHLGLCTRCFNDPKYRLQQGQCVEKVTCQANEYLSENNLCLPVSKDCLLFNPTNGDCISCKSGVDPHEGHCCPVGQIYRENRCIDVVRLQKSIQSKSGSECVAYHPALGYCLGCHPGFTPDYVTQTTCVPQ